MADLIKFIKQLTSPNTNNNSMDGKRQVATRLKFIASIAPHEKIDSHNLRIESATLWTPIRRFLYGDSRESTLTFFSSTISRTFEIIDANIHSKNMADKLFCANVITDLMSAVNGLKAFQKTYEEDKLVSCEISVIIESIEAKIFSIKETNPDMFTIKDKFITQIDKNDKSFKENDRADSKQVYRLTTPINESNSSSSSVNRKPVFENSLNFIREDETEEEHYPSIEENK
jgi:hypothetical protein